MKINENLVKSLFPFHNFPIMRYSFPNKVEREKVS